jgi:hypothetical protein
MKMGKDGLEPETFPTRAEIQAVKYVGGRFVQYTSGFDLTRMAFGDTHTHILLALAALVLERMYLRSEDSPGIQSVVDVHSFDATTAYRHAPGGPNTPKTLEFNDVVTDIAHLDPTRMNGENSNPAPNALKPNIQHCLCVYLNGEILTYPLPWEKTPPPPPRQK